MKGTGIDWHFRGQTSRSGSRSSGQLYVQPEPVNSHQSKKMKVPEPEVREMVNTDSCAHEVEARPSVDDQLTTAP